MTPRTPSVVVAFAGVFTLAAACASAPDRRMHRALDASMERVLQTESYLQSVSGISSHPSRLTRGDGFVYISDVARVLRFFAETRDTVRFRALRGFMAEKLVRQGPSGLEVSRRYRSDQAFERATASGYQWTTKALTDGWRLLGDTASARLLAQSAPFDAAATQNPSVLHRAAMACADAVEVVQADPAPARALLVGAKKLVGRQKAAEEQAAMRSTAAEGELDLLSCLTRAGVALKDPDATVRYLDDLLDHLHQMLTHAGRPDIGTAADVLVTLRRVREAGPEYARYLPAEPPPPRSRAVQVSRDP